MPPTLTARLLEFAISDLVKPGQKESGDRALVRESGAGVLVAVIDGLGYGPEAGRAAEMAITVLRLSPSQDPHELIAGCHGALRFSRGATMTVAFVDAATSVMSWAGVGGVTAVVRRAGAAAVRTVELVARPGIVGQEIPLLRRREVRLGRGDLLVLATDGVRATFEEELTVMEPQEPPAGLAERIARGHALGTDDALVLVGRWLGQPPA